MNFEPIEEVTVRNSKERTQSWRGGATVLDLRSEILIHRRPVPIKASANRCGYCFFLTGPWATASRGRTMSRRCEADNRGTSFFQWWAHASEASPTRH